jgi:Spy/CpxP family protein refolding chaperone
VSKRITVTVLALVAVATIVFAQGVPKHDPQQHIQNHLKFLTTVLSLTQQQQQQATTIFTNAAGNHQQIYASMKTAHESLQTAIKNNDGAGIEQASTQIGNLVAQMTASHAKAQAAFYQILTPEQQTKFNELQAEGHGHGMMFGGPRMH